jgi:hypothetical protein
MESLGGDATPVPAQVLGAEEDADVVDPFEDLLHLLGNRESVSQLFELLQRYRQLEVTASSGNQVIDPSKWVEAIRGTSVAITDVPLPHRTTKLRSAGVVTPPQTPEKDRVAAKDRFDHRPVLGTNGFGTTHAVGRITNFVECPSRKAATFKALADRPISISMVGLALVFGKTLSKHFFNNAMQTVDIFKDEFGYSLDEFIGQRWFVVKPNQPSDKFPGTFRLNYVKSGCCVEAHLRSLKAATNNNYLRISAYIDHLYSHLVDPEKNNLYIRAARKWQT